MKHFRPYQVEGAARLAAASRLYLGDEPGLGKTRTALLGAVMAGVSRVAVACPAIVRDHWYREAMLIAPDIDLQVASYQALVVSQDARRAWARVHPDLIILDEAHFLQNRESARTKILLGSAQGLVHDVERVWPLSGTPMPRHPGQLFPILYALWRKELAAVGLTGYMEFLNRFAAWKATDYGIRVFNVKNVALLRQLLAPILLRRRTRDVAPDLPPLRYSVLALSCDDLGKMDLSYLSAVTRAAIANGAIPPLDPHIARARHELGDLKAGVCADLIADELSNTDEKYFIGAYHHSVLDILEQRLKKFGVVRIDGTVSEGRRLALKQQFIDGTQTRVFLGQTQAVGVGMDGLQAVCHEAFLVEPEWDSMFNEQFGRRLARLGQAMPVHVRMLSLAGTLDDAIVRNHHREVQMRLAVVD